MRAKFTLRIQFGLQQDPAYVVEQLERLRKAAPFEEVMFFFYAEDYNDGHESLARIGQWIEHTRPAREMLKRNGIEVSLNPWHSLLHADRGRRLKPDQPWQTMVDPTGRAATAQVCPLDSGWRRYFATQLEMYGPEGFRVVWIDDDIRFHNHAPLTWGGCFCPLHVAEFNRRAKTKATREAIVAACTAPGRPHPWRKRWLDMWDDTQLALLTSWRKLLARHGTRLGLMSSTLEAHAAEGRRWAKWWKAIGGSQPPVHRPHFCSYGETPGRNLPTFIARLDQGVESQPVDPRHPGRRRVESGPELDNGPYGPWNKPFSETAAQWALAQLSGADRLNISLFDFVGNDYRHELERFSFLRQQAEALTFLRQQVPVGLRPVGVGIPWSESAGRAIHTAAVAKGGQPSWFQLVCPMHGAANWLGAAGIGFQMRPSERVNALAGDVVWAFSDGELRRLLSRGLLLDGTAARILALRGLGGEIGMARGRGRETGRWLVQEHTPYSIERATGAAWAHSPGAMFSINTTSPVIFQAELAGEAKVASEILNGRTEVVGHGMWVYENARGGRVAVTPHLWSPAPSLGAELAHAAGGLAVEMSTQRAGQIRATVDWLNGGAAPGRVTGPAWPASDGGAAWLVPQFFADLRGGKRGRAVVWNGSADGVREFTVLPPAGFAVFRQATQVAADGSRLAAAVGRDGRVRLKKPLQTWEYVVLGA